MLISPLMNHLIVRGRLVVLDPKGKSYIYGSEEQPYVTVRVHRQVALFKILFNPSLGIPEAYMDGDLTVEKGSLYDFLDFMAQNLAVAGPSFLMRFWEKLGYLLRGFMQYNPIVRSRKHVEHHYDLTRDFYQLFLDDDMQYSCAYFLGPDDDIDMAQMQKKDHLASKLLLKSGLKVLDIGSGWGGLGIYLAKKERVDVTGLTLSQEQYKVAEDRAMASGLSEKVRFRLRDYREETEIYDRIVSVGMFEHVGVPYYEDFFRAISGGLRSDGVALLHTIGRTHGPGVTHPFIRKYIFPGGYIPALSEIIPVVEQTGLIITDIEVLRLHYAETLRAWRQRLLKNWRCAASLQDDRFCRMWEYYLAASEVCFRYLGLVVFQIQLAKRIDIVPFTRDYIS